MSYPYPQDRHRDRKEKGEQPYKDARESMAMAEAELHQAASGGLVDQNESPETHAERLRADATERLSRVTYEIEEDRMGPNASIEPTKWESGA